jgi:hypothetical protein
MDHLFCLAFPGDGWSSRVLDAVVHGCIPVVVQDESEMFFEGAFAAAGLPMDYANFSVRIAEAELHNLVPILKAVPPARVRRMRRVVLWLRDYFVYKDMYNPSPTSRRQLLASGREGQDAFLLLTLALEARARALGRLPRDRSAWQPRSQLMLQASGKEQASFSSAADDVVSRPHEHHQVGGGARGGSAGAGDTSQGGGAIAVDYLGRGGGRPKQAKLRRRARRANRVRSEKVVAVGH